jgi:hypothetical protein
MINHSIPLSPLFSASLYTHTAKRIATMKMAAMMGIPINGNQYGCNIILSPKFAYVLV